MLVPANCLLGGGESRDLTPLDEAGLQQVVVLECGEEVPAGAEVVRDGAEGSQELLRVRRGLEALQRPFSSPSRPVRVLDAVVAKPRFGGPPR